MEFANLGWCLNGEKCTARHTFDCPDFLEKGTCDRKGCKLQHVIRSNEPSDIMVGEQNAKQENSRTSLISAVGDSNQRKRKGDEEEEEEHSEVDDDAVISFAQNGRKKSKKAKGFTEQKDYIGFNDEDDEEEESSEEEDDDASVSSGIESSDDDSDHSESDGSSDSESE